MSEKEIVKVEGVVKQVPAATAGEPPLTILQDISFQVTAGESVAIVGASGSGKSTLLGLLAGLDLPSAGQIYLAGRELGGMDEDARARLRGEVLGFVFQSFQLLPGLSALENVMLPFELAGKAEPEKQARVWLERVGLGHRLKHYPKYLSGGEQQRVALARAFAPRPRLVLADEPTGNLDAETGARIVDLMFEINQQENTTLVLVTHDEGIASRCDRVLRMRAGHLQGDYSTQVV